MADTVHLLQAFADAAMGHYLPHRKERARVLLNSLSERLGPKEFLDLEDAWRHHRVGYPHDRQIFCQVIKELKERYASQV